ncbi:hypothetical protein WR25_19950 isoform B [Diploscapter pachys]|uniref:NADP-dependent oxidoreductase domain-containing protein n=2 Tax=Diploscapter pachys TaxID=2018661 RepID=A0A2A2KAW8_9BILA|nr:hypothetical protein WR25_19950 isoform B [Diploscapter pachys]
MSSTIKLNSGHEMPILGLGTYLTKSQQMDEVLPEAIKTGYKLIDTAFAYGNQEGIGMTIGKLIEEGKIKRDNLFIETKIWNTMHTYERAKEAINENLRQLNLPYVDLMLIHYPMAVKPGDAMFPLDDYGKVIEGDGHFTEVWRALEDAVAEGKVKSIGISNFNHKQIERLLAIAKIKPAVNQIEMHPYLQQQKLREFCKEKNIAITAYGSLSSPGDKVYRNMEVPNLLTDPVIVEIAKKHNRTPAQIALRWALQNGVAIIPKADDPSEKNKEFICIF